MLCLVCGHVMMWTEALTLRELTPDEYAEAGTNYDLMRARAKVGPHRGIQHKGTSIFLSCFAILIVIMLVLEKFGVSVLHLHR